MNDNDVLQIKDRLTRLEVTVEQKWESHDKRADERWADLMETIHELKNSRSCVTHGELLVNLNSRVKNLEEYRTTINWAVGVVYIAVVGALIKLFIG